MSEVQSIEWMERRLEGLAQEVAARQAQFDRRQAAINELQRQLNANNEYLTSESEQLAEVKATKGRVENQLNRARQAERKATSRTKRGL